MFRIFFCLVAGAICQMAHSLGRSYNCTLFSREDDFPRIMVTHGARFIGSSLVKKLKFLNYSSVKVVDNFWHGIRSDLIYSDGRPVLNEQRDICVADLSEVSSSMRMFTNVDWVIHLSDAVSAAYSNLDHPPRWHRENILVNTNVMTAANHHKAVKYVYVGTAFSFPQGFQKSGTPQDPVAFNEAQMFPDHPKYSYGWSKLIGEHEVSLMANMNASVLRLHNVYGPGAAYTDTSKAQAISSIIRKAINSPAERFSVWGSGSQFRDFVFVDDVVDALVASMKRRSFIGVAQIGTGVATKLRDAAVHIANLTSKCLKKDLNIFYDTTMRDGDQGGVATVKKARRVLNWTPKVSITHGIALSYAWILRDMAAASPNKTQLLQYALCMDKESERERELLWTPPTRQAKGYKIVIPRSEGDISAVLPHLFCADERQSILQEIDEMPPTNRILVVLLSSTRGGHITYESFSENVLKHLNADLALAVESQEFDMPDAYRRNATYLWELNPPRNNDFMHFYNEISTQCFNHPFNESYASTIGTVGKATSGWLGCINAAKQPACSGQIIFFRWFALQNILKDKLYGKYDTVIISRSDELWVAPHSSEPFPVTKGTIYTPRATDYGGLSDRHYVMSMYDAVNTLGLADIIVEREDAFDQKKWLLSKGYGAAKNLETAHMLWHLKIKNMTVVRYQPTNLLVGDSSDGTKSRWHTNVNMKFHGAYFSVCYKTEHDILHKEGLL